MIPYSIAMFYTSKLLDYSTVNITNKPCDTWIDKYTDVDQKVLHVLAFAESHRQAQAWKYNDKIRRKTSVSLIDFNIIKD
jgi:hypothetical protein